MAFLPSDIAAQALDAIGSERTLGDIEDGTREAEVLLRAYNECRRQLLRTAHWDFSRRQAPMTLLADCTGQTPDVGTVVQQPWTYCYAYPIDCVKARFVPQNQNGLVTGTPSGNIALPSVPLTTGTGQPPLNQMRLIPARFLVGTDYNNIPANTGYDTPTLSPTSRMAVFTNVQAAQLIYTADMEYPSMWDPLFRGAMVAYLASEVALALSKDKRFGLELRAQQIAIAKDKIQQARVRDGNEGFYSSDIAVDWMRARSSGGYASGWGGGVGPGVLGYGWDACSFAGETTAY